MYMLAQRLQRPSTTPFAPIPISRDATSDADLQSADSGGVDPDPSCSEPQFLAIVRKKGRPRLSKMITRESSAIA